MSKQIPWLRVFVEGVVIVGSILLAFGIDAWWDGRQAEAARQEWLVALEADFETNASLAARYVDRSAGDRDLARRFVLMNAEEAAQIPQDSTWTYLVALFRPNPAPELASEDDELRRAIGEWRTAISYVNEFDARLWELLSLVQSALGKYPELQRAFAETDGTGGALTPLPGTFAAEVRADDQVMNLAAQKVFAATVQMMLLSDVVDAAEKAREVAGEARAR